jgi:hypothetical protein
MFPVLHVVGGLFKGQVLRMPKDVEVTHWSRGIAAMSHAVKGDFRGGLGRNGIGNEPACSLEALGDLLVTTNQDQIDRITGYPRGGLGEPGQGTEVNRVGIKPNQQSAREQ